MIVPISETKQAKPTMFTTKPQYRGAIVAGQQCRLGVGEITPISIYAELDSAGCVMSAAAHVFPRTKGSITPHDLSVRCSKLLCILPATTFKYTTFFAVVNSCHFLDDRGIVVQYSQLIFYSVELAKPCGL